MKAIIHTDGGSRGNPGPAAIGIVIEFPDSEKKTIEIGEKIGETTNNVAEYKAIIRALKEAASLGVTDADCFLDSELVVRQVTGVYRIKDARLALLAQEIREIKKQIPKITYTSIPREKNKQADKLVNKALDGLQEAS